MESDPHLQAVLTQLLPGTAAVQAFTLIVEFNDSPEGLVVSVEVIIGAAAKGYDVKNPSE